VSPRQRRCRTTALQQQPTAHHCLGAGIRLGLGGGPGPTTSGLFIL